MTDIEILEQLLSGNHLNADELRRARIITYLLYDDVKKRLRQ